MNIHFLNDNYTKAGLQVTNGVRVWRCYYDYSYSGRKCTGILEPKELEWNDSKCCWVQPGTSKKIKNDSRAWYFRTEEECLKRFDESLSSHASSMASNVRMDLNAIKSIHKRLTNKNIPEFVDIKQELIKIIQQL